MPSPDSDTSQGYVAVAGTQVPQDFVYLAVLNNAYNDLKKYKAFMQEFRKYGIQPSDSEILDFPHLQYFVDAIHAENPSRNIEVFKGGWGGEVMAQRRYWTTGCNPPLYDFLQKPFRPYPPQKELHKIGIGNIAGTAHANVFSLFKDKDGNTSIIVVDSVFPRGNPTPSDKDAWTFSDLHVISEFAASSPKNHAAFIPTEAQKTPGGCVMHAVQTAILMCDDMPFWAEMHRNMHAGRSLHPKARAWRADNRLFQKYFQELPNSDGRFSVVQANFLPEKYLYNANALTTVMKYIDNQDAGYDGSNLINVFKSVTVRKADLDGDELNDFMKVSEHIKRDAVEYKLRKSKDTYVLTPPGSEPLSIDADANPEIRMILVRQQMNGGRDLIEDTFSPRALIKRPSAPPPDQIQRAASEIREELEENRLEDNEKSAKLTQLLTSFAEAIEFDKVRQGLGMGDDVQEYLVKENAQGYVVRYAVRNTSTVHTRVLHSAPHTAEILQILAKQAPHLPEDDRLSFSGDHPMATPKFSGIQAPDQQFTSDEQITYEKIDFSNISAVLTYADGRQTEPNIIKEGRSETGNFKAVTESFNGWVSHSWLYYNKHIDIENRPDLIDLTLRYMEDNLLPPKLLEPEVITVSQPESSKSSTQEATTSKQPEAFVDIYDATSPPTGVTPSATTKEPETGNKRGLASLGKPLEFDTDKVRILEGGRTLRMTSARRAQIEASSSRQNAQEEARNRTTRPLVPNPLGGLTPPPPTPTTPSNARGRKRN